MQIHPGGLPQPGLVEEELMERIKAFAVKANAGPLTTARKHAVLVWTLAGNAWHLGGEFPLLDTDPVAAALEVAPETESFEPQDPDAYQRHHISSQFAERHIFVVSMFQSHVQCVRNAAW